MRTLPILLVLTVAFTTGCGAEDAKLSCDDGTTEQDGECVGTEEADADDTDADDDDDTSTALAEDGDCDGVLTADDCDDTDGASTTLAEDGDCDGIVTAEDCDDEDNASTTVAEDADCDGVVDADADGTGSTDSDDDAATVAAVGPEKTGSSGGCTTVQSSIPRQAAPWAFALLALSVFRRERD